ncbi:hypothetical protein HAHI6034_08475 [Hathewaya histolytica]|uniref:Uncharacterized protein n=1 Tax=Hathewaya histolytica TaxID=1498 RepID=A0A4U9R8I3_HATHI|nr:hypothetical protein [Hathewaya histolytica]VTQ85000.1 Uncharacterised protein [Hathewaya histolytica]
MSYRRVIDNYYCDINNMTELLLKLVNSYRLLVGGADELNKIALASKGDIKKALKRAERAGELIDELLDELDCTVGCYTKYCNVKSKVLKVRIGEREILTEIEETLKFKE